MLNKKIKLHQWLILIIGVVLFIVPWFWFKGYFVGNDDTALFYQYPNEYLENFISNTIDNNSLGTLGYYFPQSANFAFTFLLKIIHDLCPLLNLQKLFFAISLSTSFLFFYLMLRRLLNQKSSDPYGSIVGSLFYALSPILLFNLWNTPLTNTFLISLMPCFLWLLLLALQKNNQRFAVLISLLATLFSLLPAQTPWIMGTILILSPLFIYLAITYKKKFLISAIVIVSTYLLLNIFWIFHFVNSFSPKYQTLLSVISQEQFLQENAQHIHAVSNSLSLWSPLGNLGHTKIFENWGFPTYEVFANWNLPLSQLNLVFMLVIISGLLVVDKNEIKLLNKILLLSFLLALYLYTVNIGDWGEKLFIWLNNYVPGFTMFRNPHDKFALGMSIILSLLFAMTLGFLLKKIKNKNIVILCLCLLVVINAIPFLRGNYFNTSTLQKTSVVPTVEQLNSDFFALTDFVEQNNLTGRFMWYPFGLNNYNVFIESKEDRQHYYAGISPFQIFTGQPDIESAAHTSPFIKEMEEIIERDDSLGMQNMLQKFNVNYVITYNNLSSEIKQQLFSEKSSNYVNPTMFKDFFGEKKADFGGNYSLYEVSEVFSTNKIFLADDTSTDAAVFDNWNDVYYQYDGDGEYNVVINNLDHKTNLVLLGLYQSDWKIFADKQQLDLEQQSVLGFANSWIIDPSNVINKYGDNPNISVNEDGSINLKLKIVFLPLLLDSLLRHISLASLGGCILYLMLGFLRKKDKIESE